MRLGGSEFSACILQRKIDETLDLEYQSLVSPSISYRITRSRPFAVLAALTPAAGVAAIQGPA